MDLKKILKRRDELMEIYLASPVGTEDWRRCGNELDKIDECVLAEMDENDPEKVAVLDKNVDVDGPMEEVIKISRKDERNSAI